MATWDEASLILCGVAAIPWFILGLVGWEYIVHLRWFWGKGRVSLLNNRIAYAFSYAFQFALIPPAIIFI